MTLDEAALQAAIAARSDKASAPSLMAAVFTPAGVAWRGSVADEGGVGAQYRIGSITKTFTAVAIMQLRDDGLIGLDDEVGAHLPDAPYADHTIRRLLAHTSGMTAEPAGAWWERMPGVSWPELAEANAAARDVMPAGSRHHYSNLGFAILGELIARRRGMTWWSAVEESILTPLGLRDTTYHPRSGAAVGSSRNPLTGELMREPSHDSGAMAPAGQLWSTVDDLARWGGFLVTGHPDVLPQSTLTEMRTSRGTDADNQHVGAYGLGLRLRWATNGTILGHTGSMPGFLAGVFVNATTKVGATVLTNVTTGVAPEATAVELIDLASQSLATTDPAAPAAEAGEPVEWAELAGAWYWGNTLVNIRVTRDGLTLRDDDEAIAFSRIGADRFIGHRGYFAGEVLEVARRDDGSISHLEVVTFVMTRVPYDPTAPIPGGLPESFSSPG